MSQLVHLLWTGGWDSTFRLLDLVLGQQCEVQPHYLLDGRPSLRMELICMGEIKRAIRKRAPEAAHLIHPTIITDQVDLPEDPHRYRQFMALRAKSYIGGQYALLARLADHLNISELEVGVHSQDKAALFLREVLVRNDNRYCLPAELSDPNLKLFERFSFPLFGMTKIDMQELADRCGWRDLMEKTWFCYSPTASDQPCGICNPCIYAIEDGMGRRLSLRARMRGQIRRRLRYFWHRVQGSARISTGPRIQP